MFRSYGNQSIQFDGLINETQFLMSVLYSLYSMYESNGNFLISKEIQIMNLNFSGFIWRKNIPANRGRRLR